MKRFKYTILILGLIVYFKDIIYTQTNSIECLESIEKKSNYRLTLALSLLGIIGFYNHQKIISGYKNYPFSSLILSYLAGTIFIDTYTKYKIIHKNLFLLKIINQIYLYLQSALLIEPDEKKCFQLIEQYSSFSIDEIEKITHAVTTNSINCINCTPTSEIVFECPNIHQLSYCHINVDEIINKLENDSDVYKELMSFKKHTLLDKNKFFEKIGKKIDNKINFLIKNKNFEKIKGK